MTLEEYMSQKATLQQQAAYVDFCNEINEDFFLQFSLSSFEDFYKTWCREHGTFSDGLCFP